MFFILFCVSLWLFWVWYTRESKFKPPVMSGVLPLVGHALEGLGDGAQTYKVIKRMSEESQQKDGVFRAYFGPIMIYGVTDPDDAITIGNSCLRKHMMYDVAKVFLKNGLAIADVHTWKKNRKLLNPAFAPQVLVSLLDTFNSQARTLVELLGKEEGKVFDHEGIIRNNVLETVCMANLGTDAQEFKDVQEQYVPHWNEILMIIDERSRKAWLLSDMLFNMTSLKKAQDRHVEITSRLANTIIQKKLKDIENDSPTETKTDNQKTFIKTVLKLVNDGLFSDEDIQGEIETMIAASHDTMASTLTIALTLLGSYLDVQERAYQEIVQIVGDTEKDVEKNDLAQLKYLDAVIKETLRLYPSVPVIGRQFDNEIKLKKYTLKPNLGGCFISLHGILRDKMWGEDRHDFRPDRWLEKDMLPDPKYFAAFGVGRRFCIGKQFAMISMKITLAHVLRHYKISSDVTKMVIKTTVAMRPESGHEINIQRRI